MTNLIECLESRCLLSQYWVSPTGNDLSDGSQSTPWQTLQHAADIGVGGDTIHIQSGNYAGFAIHGLKVGNGYGMAFIGEGTVVIDRPNPETYDAILVDGRGRTDQQILIGNLHINNENGLIRRDGIYINNSDSVHIWATFIDRMASYGIFVNNSNNTTISYSSISRTDGMDGIYIGGNSQTPIVEGCHLWGNYGAGIRLNGDKTATTSGFIYYATVRGNYIYNNGLGGSAGIDLDGVNNSTVENNLLYDNSGDGIALHKAMGGGGSSNNLIQNNTVIQASYTHWPLSIYNGSTANTVKNNILYNYDNRVPTTSFSMKAIAYGLELDTEDGLVVTIGNPTPKGSIDIDSASDVNFRSNKNICNGIFGKDGAIMDLPSWRSQTGHDTESFVSNPTDIFVDPTKLDYRLKDHSTAKDVGDAATIISNDILGYNRDGVVDIGAYEYHPYNYPLSPYDLIGYNISTGSINLQWNRDTDNSDTIYVEQYEPGIGFPILATLPANALSYTLTGLTENKQYFFRIRATNATGASAISNILSIVTIDYPAGSPSALTTWVGVEQQISVGWTYTGSDALAFIVQRRQLPTDSWMLVGSTSYATKSFVDKGLSAGTNYTYRVGVLNGSAIAYSDPITAMSLMAAPTGLTATYASKKITLNWNDNSTNEGGFKIYRKVGPATSWTYLGIVGANVKTYVDSSIVVNTKYTYAVKSYMKVGTTTYESLLSTAASVTTPAVFTRPLAISPAKKLYVVKVYNKAYLHDSTAKRADFIVIGNPKQMDYDIEEALPYMPNLSRIDSFVVFFYDKAKVKNYTWHGVKIPIIKVGKEVTRIYPS